MNVKYKLTKLESSHNNIRTDEVIGTVVSEPIVGNSFLILSEPLDPALDMRVIRTTTVQEVERIAKNIIQFRTKNSTYLLEKVVE